MNSFIISNFLLPVWQVLEHQLNTESSRLLFKRAHYLGTATTKNLKNSNILSHKRFYELSTSRNFILVPFTCLLNQTFPWTINTCFILFVVLQTTFMDCCFHKIFKSNSNWWFKKSIDKWTKLNKEETFIWLQVRYMNLLV